MARFRLICGDSLVEIPRLKHKFQLVIADPPFNIGHPYRGFTDKTADYAGWTEKWLGACWHACDGVLCLHGPDALATLWIDLERPLGLRDRRIAWVNWHYRFGQCSRSNWIDARCHCLIYAKHEKWTWNPEEVLVESDRSSTYKDKRIHDSPNGGRRLPGTVWGVPSDGPHWGRVTGGSRERNRNSPNQLPEKYVERLIKAYSDPGDMILVPFAGSGTEMAVALALGRDVVGIEVSRRSVDSIRERILKGSVRVKEQ